jgi:hypothetical protein
MHVISLIRVYLGGLESTGHPSLRQSVNAIELPPTRHVTIPNSERNPIPNTQ